MNAQAEIFAAATIKRYDMSLWESQRAADTAGFIDNLNQIGGHMREKRENSKAEKEFREGYARALAVAKRTGDMPVEYQQLVPIDRVGRQVGIKVVALRELSKVDPTHPLVASAAVRENIGTQTLINYNKSERPSGADLNDYAPSDSAAQKIYDLTLAR